MIPIVEENGKKVFIGKEDQSNPPIFVRNPMKRYCPKGHENDNDQTHCKDCSRELDGDGKMQCQICKRFFDYLVGENSGGGKQGCEACFKPPIRKVEHDETPTGEIFN